MLEINRKKKDLVLNIRMRREFGLHTCTNESFHIFFVESGRKPPRKNQHSECIRKSEDDKRMPSPCRRGYLCRWVVIT